MTALSDTLSAATTDIRRRVMEEAPGAMRRTFTLREFARLVESSAAGTVEELVADCARRRGSLAGAELDVPDPIGRSAEVHAEAADLAGAAVETFAHAMVRLSRT